MLKTPDNQLVGISKTAINTVTALARLSLGTSVINNDEQGLNQALEQIGFFSETILLINAKRF